MSKKNSKRVAVVSRETEFIDEEAKFRLKYQSLLEEYLELQKMKTLIKYYLMKTIIVAFDDEDKNKIEVDDELYVASFISTGWSIKDFVSKKKKLQIAQQKRDILSDEVQFLRQRHRHLMKIKFDNFQSEEDIIQQQNSPMKTEVLGAPVKKKLKTCLINGKKLAKKKILWEDQVASKV